MPRTLSTAALKAILAQQTGEAFLVFLRLDHPSLTQPIRVVNDGVDHVVDGLTWACLPRGWISSRRGPARRFSA